MTSDDLLKLLAARHNRERGWVFESELALSYNRRRLDAFALQMMDGMHPVEARDILVAMARSASGWSAA